MKILKELVMREIAGDVILVPVGKTVFENNGLFVMNEVSADIWKLINEGKDQEEIVSAMARMYDAEPEMIRADTEAFLNKLVNMGILEL